MSEFHTTREVAALLRVRERKIYDLVSRAAIPHRKVTGKLLFAKDEIEAWMRGAPAAETAAPIPAPRLVDPPPIVTGGHDPLLEWALRRSGSGIAAFLDGALDGLQRADAGTCIAAGLHVPGVGDDEWNVGAVAERFTDRPWVLIEFARRRRGLVVGRDVRPVPKSLAASRGRRFQGRQPGAGSQLILERLLARDGLCLADLDLVATPERSETELAEAIAAGRADVGLGIECGARRFGLGFVPLLEERFDLLVLRKAWFDPPFQRFLGFCAGPEFRDKAAELGGYDVSGFGRVRFNGA
jgi:excisionase family DNA binding protein